MSQIIIIALGVCGGLLLFANFNAILQAAGNMIKGAVVLAGGLAIGLAVAFVMAVVIVAGFISPAMIAEHFYGPAAGEVAYQMTLKSLGIAFAVGAVIAGIRKARSGVRRSVNWIAKLRFDPVERALLLSRLRGSLAVLLLIAILALIARIVHS